VKIRDLFDDDGLRKGADIARLGVDLDGSSRAVANVFLDAVNKAPEIASTRISRLIPRSRSR